MDEREKQRDQEGADSEPEEVVAETEAVDTETSEQGPVETEAPEAAEPVDDAGADEDAQPEAASAEADAADEGAPVTAAAEADDAAPTTTPTRQQRRRGTVERERVSVELNAIFGRKLGMLQIFDESGVVQNVTAIEAGPCVVTMIRRPDRDGYAAIQLGWGENKKLTRPAKGHLKEANGSFRHLREVRVDDIEGVAVGQEVAADIFAAGERVDVTATSKGRGFAGGVKRHGFHGGPKTHGQSDRHRAPGSIGAGTTPGHVLKGQKMAGHMGAQQVTVRSLTVVQADADKNLILVRGSVPGPINGLVQVKRTTRVGTR
jgi:large subunit ribosomal protein L3